METYYYGRQSILIGRHVRYSCSTPLTVTRDLDFQSPANCDMIHTRPKIKDIGQLTTCRMETDGWTDTTVLLWRQDILQGNLCVCESVCLFPCFLYKSLFTENSVATQKHSSANINTNKIQYKMQRSSPSQ